VAGSGRNDDGGSPFPDMVTRAWVKELKHRRRLLEG
jgi:serine/threonine-protein kinase HipA